MGWDYVYIFYFISYFQIGPWCYYFILLSKFMAVPIFSHIHQTFFCRLDFDSVIDEMFWFASLCPLDISSFLHVLQITSFPTISCFTFFMLTFVKVLNSDSVNCAHLFLYELLS